MGQTTLARGLTTAGLPATSYVNYEEPGTFNAPGVAWRPDDHYVAVAAGLGDTQGIKIALVTSSGLQLIKLPSLDIQKFLGAQSILKNARIYGHFVNPIRWENSNRPEPLFPALLNRN